MLTLEMGLPLHFRPKHLIVLLDLNGLCPTASVTGKRTAHCTLEDR